MSRRVGWMGRLCSHAQPVELLPDVLSRLVALAILLPEAVSVMQQLAGNRDDRLVLAQARLQPGQLSLSMRM